MAERRPIPGKAIGGAILLAGAVIALVVLRAKHEPLVAPDASAPDERPSTVATTTSTTPATTTPTGTAPAEPSGGIPLGAAFTEARRLGDARAALAHKDPKTALQLLDDYELATRGEGTLRHEATLLRIEALPKVGRRTDALALAMAARDDSSWSSDEHERLQALLSDAGL